MPMTMSPVITSYSIHYTKLYDYAADVGPDSGSGLGGCPVHRHLRERDLDALGVEGQFHLLLHVEEDTPRNNFV